MGRGSLFLQVPLQQSRPAVAGTTALFALLSLENAVRCAHAKASGPNPVSASDSISFFEKVCSPPTRLLWPATDTDTFLSCRHRKHQTEIQLREWQYQSVHIWKHAPLKAFNSQGIFGHTQMKLSQQDFQLACCHHPRQPESC